MAKLLIKHRIWKFVKSSDQINHEKLLFLKKKEIDKVWNIGETLLGVPKDELGIEFIYEVDRVIFMLDDFLYKDIHTLLWLFNSRLSALFIGKSLRSFGGMSKEKRMQYMDKWMKSKIPLLRTSYGVLRALISWGYYSLEKGHIEMDFLGPTIGKEDVTPTLLFGKQPLDPATYLEEEVIS